MSAQLLMVDPPTADTEASWACKSHINDGESSDGGSCKSNHAGNRTDMVVGMKNHIAIVPSPQREQRIHRTSHVYSWSDLVSNNALICDMTWWLLTCLQLQRIAPTIVSSYSSWRIWTRSLQKNVNNIYAGWWVKWWIPSIFSNSNHTVHPQ